VEHGLGNNMGFYDDMQGVAVSLLTEFKQGTITLTRTTPGAVDANESWTPVADSTVRYSLNAVAKSVDDKFVDGKMIFSTDVIITASPIMLKTHVDGSPVTNVNTELEVLAGDKITMDSKELEILKTMRIPRAGTAIAWKFIVRG